MDSSDETDDPPTLMPRPSHMLSPSTGNLEEKVRRWSVDDGAEAGAETISTQDVETAVSSHHVVDSAMPSPAPDVDFRPAPLFSKSSDSSSRTPASLGPESSPCPEATKAHGQDADSSVERNGDVPIVLDDDTQISQATMETETRENAVVGDYLKMKFVENRVVPTILVSCAPSTDPLTDELTCPCRASSFGFRGTTSFTTWFMM